MKYILLILVTFTSLFASDFYYEFDKKVEMKPSLKTQSTSENAILEYETTDGKKVKFKNEIMVVCKKNAYCEDDFSDLSISNYEEIANGYFLIKVGSTQNIFTLAQQLYLKDDIKIAHPNYIHYLEKR